MSTRRSTTDEPQFDQTLQSLIAIVRVFSREGALLLDRVGIDGEALGARLRTMLLAFPASLLSRALPGARPGQIERLRSEALLLADRIGSLRHARDNAGGRIQRLEAATESFEVAAERIERLRASVDTQGERLDRIGAALARRKARRLDRLRRLRELESVVARIENGVERQVARQGASPAPPVSCEDVGVMGSGSGPHREPARVIALALHRKAASDS